MHALGAVASGITGSPSLTRSIVEVTDHLHNNRLDIKNMLNCEISLIR